MSTKSRLLQTPSLPHQSFDAIALYSQSEQLGWSTETNQHTTALKSFQMMQGTDIVDRKALGFCKQQGNAFPAFQPLGSGQ